MNLVTAFLVALLAGMVLISFLKGKGKSGVFFAAVLLLAGMSGVPAWQALSGSPVEWIFPGNMVTGEIPLRLDALSAWFILIINLVFLTGGMYGVYYLQARSCTSDPSLTYPNGEGTNSPPLEGPGEVVHYLSFLLLYASLIALSVIQNSLVFLIAWEIMTLSAFMVVIYEHRKAETIKAGINFLVQSHVSVLFLMTGFIWAAVQTGSYDFASLGQLEQLGDLNNSPDNSIVFIILLFFIIGFGIKAGFVPFHTWLPYAHPAAPAHISGIMSGVMIKIGIFGILRMLLILPVDYTVVGYLLLAISLVSGLFGVMQAIVQHNLKKLLAYHSVENIGIIGLGMGIGCIGLGMDNPLIASLGFAGALLHTLNHALFKSLLFFAAGIVYKATHTLDVEHLGGLIKKMPQTAALFLVAAIAICGIPPFNGFISEFIIYSGLYNWILTAPLVPAIIALLMILGLVLIGGLALLCFTKAFGIVFLGSPRKEPDHEIKEPSFGQLLPLYFTGILIAGIGLFPQLFIRMLMEPVTLFTGDTTLIPSTALSELSGVLRSVSFAVWGVVLVTLVVFAIRRVAIKNNKSAIESSAIRNPPSALLTWGCGYTGSSPKLQYTASSFVRSYRKLAAPALLIRQHRKEVSGIFPTGGAYESHAYDKVEKWLIDKPVTALQSFMSRFLFFQNGRLQSYLLYGILFIIALIFIPVIWEQLVWLFDFLKNL